MTHGEAVAFTPIEIAHPIMGGLPCSARTRTPVAMPAGMVTAGTPVDTSQEEQRQLHDDDIREALRFAAADVDQRVVPLDQTA